MENLKKLSREEMRKVVGGTGQCIVECWNGLQAYWYPVNSCSDVNVLTMCGTGDNGNCECDGN